MTIGTLATNIGFLLRRSATMSTGDVLLFLGLGFHLGLFLLLIAFRTTSEGDPAHDNGIYIVSSEVHN